ncbi:MAG TPA: hypothetical protein DDX39_06485 [Bacteroidales bacterium]|nr:MAG: hypothetical protein A2W98_05080 [Bacteroidetes bacterium GWF2_33_38]OFY90406.1 MAG: hypothetical protein A2236_01605 [Bacteroidetes bacterium RIFOXYA2_FULL_33_7]HBF88273.1 hypothetical protein [Bacteroidales bacterium]
MEMEREYIKVNKPSQLPNYIHLLKELDDDFWKKWIFYYLLTFYQNYDSIELKEKIKKSYPRVEREIAKFLRIKLNADREFSYHFTAFGENTNDEEVEGNYDITIHSTNWKSKEFHFECKNLNDSQDLVNKYVYYNTYKKDSNNENIFDGGVYRYFNGKYAQKLDFGGMIGFVLEGDVLSAKNEIISKLNEKFNTTSDGDLIRIVDNSIEENEFTFDSYHNRFSSEFIIHHLLFNFS